uniref:Chemosensory protein n=1 Tax=Dendrolimus houi TaxID=765132 RepID=A0A076E965_9NEOP|nr:chemosensory protein [Dendrolimus houi]
MNSIIILSCLLAVVACEQYTDKYDNTNLEEIMENDNLRQAYLKCLLEEGPCTAEGKKLKELLTEALETECSKCTDKQKQGAKYCIKFLIKNSPKEWEKLSKKYDPNGKYQAKYEKLAKEEDVELPK